MSSADSEGDCETFACLLTMHENEKIVGGGGGEVGECATKEREMWLDEVGKHNCSITGKRFLRNNRGESK